MSQPTALVIVLGGTMGAVMLQSPYATFVRGMRMVRWVWYPPVIDPQALIRQITVWSQLSRREGLLALENSLNQLKDPFARKGLQLLVDGAEPERLREVPSREGTSPSVQPVPGQYCGTCALAAPRTAARPPSAPQVQAESAGLNLIEHHSFRPTFS